MTDTEVSVAINDMTVSDLVKTIRERDGLSLEALGRAMGVSYVTVSHWQAGRRVPQARHLRRLRELAKIETVAESQADNRVLVRYGERIAEIGAVPSIGSIGDSYDTALAETVNSLYKTELIRQQGPWRSIDDVEVATLSWVCWFNTVRLHGTLDDVPPTEYEAAHYLHRTKANQPVGIQ